MRDIVNLQQIANELDREPPRAALDPISFAQPHHRMVPMPDYVRHRDGINKIGILTSEAMVHQFETAAKAVEAMGKELERVVSHCETVKNDAIETMQKCQETADRYREEARRTFDAVEHNALIVQHVTNVCAELRDKIASTAIVS